MVTFAPMMRPGVRTAAVLLASASFGFASLASAADTKTSSMAVGAAVTSNCTVAAGTIPFGNIDVTTGNAVDHDGTITVRCTNGTAYSLTADQGQGNAASLTNRKLTGINDNTNTLNYALFTDSGYATNWGDGNASDDIARIGTGNDQSITIYGRVLAGQQTVQKDDYADTVVVTITYN